MIRKAEPNDLERLNALLRQVLTVHYSARPDIFKKGVKKYNDGELLHILSSENSPVFVYDDGKDVKGYVFCIVKTIKDDNILMPIKTLYIDDLCVDEKERGKGIGKALYNFAKEYATKIGCYNLTLNVWADNENAVKFYNSLGLNKQKIMMEEIL